MELKKRNAIIELEDMEFYAYHGCYMDEQTIGNNFTVNVSVETDATLPAETDNIDDALNYVQIYETVKIEMEQTSHLLEHVAARIIDKIYEKFPSVTNAVVKVSKMAPPIDGRIKKISLTLKR
ncbi:MAG: dihydroneopterin aldolase [Cytophagaceae bacterium]|jgi:dihydroneopterin aldolase|nr:dihydroneopterin aldolase [Cytophagaceae bacterium]